MLAFILGEPGSSQVAQVLDGAVLSTTALTEVCYRAQQIGYRRTSADLTADFTALGVVLCEPLQPQDAWRASDLRVASYGARAQWTQRDLTTCGNGKPSTLSTVDAMVIAVSERLQLPVMTTDRAWTVLERLGLFTTKVVCLR